MIELPLYSIDILDEKGNSLLDSLNGLFSSLTIVEKIWNVTYFELQLNTCDLKPYHPFHNLKIQFKSEYCQYESYLGINSIVQAQSYTTILGYMTKWENFKLTNTRFLADNLQDAIIATEVKESLNGEQIPNQLSGDLYQVNETNLQQCMDLCRIATNNGFWSIGKDNIKLVTNETNKDITIPSSYIIEIYPTQTTDDDVLMDSSKRYSSGIYRDLSCFWDQQYDNHFTSLLQRKKQEKLGFPMYITFKGAGEYPLEIASTYNNTLKELDSIKKWVVVSITTSITMNQIESSVVLGGLE